MSAREDLATVSASCGATPMGASVRVAAIEQALHTIGEGAGGELVSGVLRGP